MSIVKEQSFEMTSPKVWNCCILLLHRSDIHGRVARLSRPAFFDSAMSELWTRWLSTFRKSNTRKLNGLTVLNTAKEFQRRFFMFSPCSVHFRGNALLCSAIFIKIDSASFFPVTRDGFCLIYRHMKLLDSKIGILEPVPQPRWRNHSLPNDMVPCVVLIVRQWKVWY